MKCDTASSKHKLISNNKSVEVLRKIDKKKSLKLTKHLKSHCETSRFSGNIQNSTLDKLGQNIIFEK